MRTRLRRKLATLTVALGLGLAASVAAAQDDDAAEARSEAFRTVDGAVQEDVPGGPLLVGAYALILAGVLGYVIHLVRLQGRMRGDIDRLSRALAEHEGGDGEG